MQLVPVPNGVHFFNVSHGFGFAFVLKSGSGSEFSLKAGSEFSLKAGSESTLSQGGSETMLSATLPVYRIPVL
jgi:hypothetical protein